MKTPLILEIKGNSLDDGPGIRSVIFFKGCPLSCLWCHNPESKSPRVEVAFDPGECVACDTCLDTCREGALSRKDPFFIDRQRCSLCFECVEQCPSGALSRVGKPMSTEEILNAVLKDKPFFETSNGGVTLSGGEPTLAIDFVAPLLKSFKENHIHTLLETCGLFDFNRFQKELYPFLDAVYFDLKIMDPDAHTRFCGVSNGLILENFKRLHTLSWDNHLELLPRVPLIPGMTDTRENLTAIAEFLFRCGVEKTALLAYHPLWQEKNLKMGLHDPNGDSPAMKAWLSPASIEKSRKIFLESGIQA